MQIQNIKNLVECLPAPFQYPCQTIRISAHGRLRDLRAETKRASIRLFFSTSTPNEKFQNFIVINNHTDREYLLIKEAYLRLVLTKPIFSTRCGWETPCWCLSIYTCDAVWYLLIYVYAGLMSTHNCWLMMKSVDIKGHKNFTQDRFEIEIFIK